MVNPYLVELKLKIISYFTSLIVQMINRIYSKWVHIYVIAPTQKTKCPHACDFPKKFRT